MQISVSVVYIIELFFILIGVMISKVCHCRLRRLDASEISR